MNPNAAEAATLTEFVERIRVHVDAFLEQALPTPPACPPLLSEAMRYSVFAGGKRFRPVLTLAAADAVRRRSAGTVRSAASPALDAALSVAVAIELIHTYSLIHDDLPAMDDDTLRRGRPTLHVVYGDAVAILAGDALQAEAFALLARSGRDPRETDGPVAARTLRVLQLVAEAAGAVGMVGGQTIDIQAARQVDGHVLTLDAERLKAMHQRKTGALIRAAAVSGAVMAGGDEQTVDAVDEWSRHVGLAFQIVDDVLDVESSAEELGKTAGKDVADDKPTYPALFGLEASKGMAVECATAAHRALVRARLTDGWLDAVAEWVISRRS
jgi:geranylgeranyl pyrophosphate synthase